MAQDPYDPSNPVRRGRRDPELAAALGMDDEHQDSGEGPLVEGPMLSTGDVVAAKVTIDVMIEGKENWFTYEARTRVMEGESEAEANERIEQIANIRAIELADNMEARLAERSAARRRRPITPAR